MTSKARILPVISTAVFLTFTGCGEVQPPPSNPRTEVVVVDSSASVIMDTDLLAAAQNRVVELIEQMSPGGTVAVKATNNVTALCSDLKITLAPAKNSTVLEEDRETKIQAAADRFPKYIDCVVNADRGGTQLLGLLAEATTSYPKAATMDVYTDGIDTYNLTGLKRGLRDPDYPTTAIADLPPSLVPTLPGDTVVIWHGLGRGTNLDAVRLSNLRQIYQTWTTATGAQAQMTSD